MAECDLKELFPVINISFEKFEKVEQNLFIINKLLELAEKGVFIDNHQDLVSILFLLSSESLKSLESIV